MNKRSEEDRRKKSISREPDRRSDLRRTEDLENRKVYYSIFIFLSIIILFFGLSSLFY